MSIAGLVAYTGPVMAYQTEFFCPLNYGLGQPISLNVFQFKNRNNQIVTCYNNPSLYCGGTNYMAVINQSNTYPCYVQNLDCTSLAYAGLPGGTPHTQAFWQLTTGEMNNNLVTTGVNSGNYANNSSTVTGNLYQSSGSNVSFCNAVPRNVIVSQDGYFLGTNNKTIVANTPVVSVNNFPTQAPVNVNTDNVTMQVAYIKNIVLVELGLITLVFIGGVLYAIIRP